MMDKRALIRVTRSQEGDISLDPTGKKPGRGAYVCANAECLEKAVTQKGLEKSFKCAVPKEVYEKLKEELAGIINL